MENTFTMVGDIKFFYTGPQYADVALDGADLIRDQGLENGALISIFTDGRADPEDTLPDAGGTLRGWWGDELLESPFPSKLWLLERSTITSSTLTLGEQYHQDALKWMVSDGLANSIEVTAARQGVNQVNFLVRIHKKGGGSIFFKWFINWNLQIFGGVA